MTDRQLINLAEQASRNAYVPYSHFAVGAALECRDGTVFTGCNIENASYTPTICAERTAIFKAVSEGWKRFLAIAIVGGAEGKPMEEYAYPCGVCRQVMREFTDPDKFIVIVARSEEDYRIFHLSDLLPQSFGPEYLHKETNESGD